MSLGDIGISTINGGAIGVKNAIINGNFGINQRGVSGTVTLAAGAYGHDRFKAGASGCTYTFATSNNITTLTISAGSLIQVIEGNNLFTGTYTLSWTGTAQGKIGAGSFAASGVTGSVTGGSNLNIEFNTGTLSLVQFEQGSVATPFERRPYGTELALCQRYGVELANGSTLVVVTGQCFGSDKGGGVLRFPVEMRAAPTITSSSASHFSLTDTTGNTAAASGQNLVFISTRAFLFELTGRSGGGLTAGNATTIFSTNSAARLFASAEL
jgi:hypothetical protein